MNLRPLHDRLVVRREAAPTMSNGGIALMDIGNEKPIRGEVLAVGPGKKGNEGKVTPMEIHVGDNILFGKYSGTEVKVDNETLVVLTEDEVFAIVTP